MWALNGIAFSKDWTRIARVCLYGKRVHRKWILSPRKAECQLKCDLFVRWNAVDAEGGEFFGTPGSPRTCSDCRVAAAARSSGPSIQLSSDGFLLVLPPPLLLPTFIPLRTDVCVCKSVCGAAAVSAIVSSHHQTTTPMQSLSSLTLSQVTHFLLPSCIAVYTTLLCELYVHYSQSCMSHLKQQAVTVLCVIFSRHMLRSWNHAHF